MKEFQNLYEVKKTVRFNLLPVNHTYKKITDEQFKHDLEKFLETYKQIVQNFSDLVFSRDEDEMKVLNRNTKISISWLKTYTKQDFHENRGNLIKRGKNGQKTNTHVSLEKTDFLLEVFQNWVERNWNEENEEKRIGILNRLEILKNQPPELQSRKADFSYLIHQIHQRTNFEFVFEFFENTQGTQSDTHIAETKPLLDECKNLLQSLENYLLPSQSMGQVIERASLNYYTVNKKPKYFSPQKTTLEEHYKSELEKLVRKKDTKLFDIKANSRKPKFIIHQSLDFLKDEIRALPDEYFVVENFNGTIKVIKDWNHLKFRYAYRFLKEYKAQQKSKLFELVLGQKTQQRIIQEVPLFDFEDTKNCKDGSVIETKEQQFQSFYDTCFEIRDKSTEYEKSKDKKFKTEITKLKKTRGDKYFYVGDTTNSQCPFPKYKSFCELFKEVATEYGKIKAKIKSLEKERVDAEKLQSWALLLEKEDQHYVMTIPRDRKVQVENKEEYQLPHAYKEVKQLNTGTGENPWTLYHFESLTLRALEKLCFGMDKNSFINDPSLSNELRCFSGYFENGKLKEKYQMMQKRPDGTFDETILIKFYKRILSLEATSKMILIEEYLPNKAAKDNIFEGKFETLKDFQIALEKQCYIRKAVKISDQKKQELETKYGASVYEITSYDLVTERKNKEAHTKLWKQFWFQDEKSGYTTRLNPEMKISYVEKRVDSVKDKAGNELARNRRKLAEYILSLTISENNDKPKFDMAFADKDKVKVNIDKFNKELNQKIKVNPYDLYYYGIDRGNEELLTLGIFKFEDQDISFTYPSDNIKSGTYKKPVPVPLEVWELPETKFSDLVSYETKSGTKSTEAYKNISYATHLLRKKTIQSCLDLTCAKMIGEKLVINGDIATYLKSKLAGACRKITDGIQNGRFVNTKIERYKKDIDGVEYGEEIFYLEIKDREEVKKYGLYFFDSRFEKINSRENIQDYLQDHFDKVKSGNVYQDVYTIEKINHLRDAICANAVGVLIHLQQKYFGMISFENLDIEKKNKHFSQNNTNLGSRIEFALLRKLQTLGLVSPNYKMVMSMQSKKEIDQLGIIAYVKTAGTSSNCPHCGQSITEKVKKEHKLKNHKYKCDDGAGISCGFSTYSQSEITQNNYEFTPDKKGLDFLHSSDDVAAYNIAKRGLELIQKSSENKPRNEGGVGIC